MRDARFSAVRLVADSPDAAAWTKLGGVRRGYHQRQGYSQRITFNCLHLLTNLIITILGWRLGDPFAAVSFRSLFFKFVQ